MFRGGGNLEDVSLEAKTAFGAAKQLGSGATHVALCNKIGPYFRHWCKVLVAKVLKDDRMIRRKDDKFETAAISRHSERLAKESSLLQNKAVAKNENNLPETVFSRFTSHFSLPKAAFTLAEGATHVALCDKFRRVAFTLAEVLITLGIIGVVAALTLPSVITNYQTKQRITQLKKVYNTLSQAYEMGVAENGGNRDIGTWGNVILHRSSNPDYVATLMQYTKPIHACSPKDDDCVNKDYVAKNLGFDQGTYLVYILEDGVIIGRGDENTPDYGIIKVDINGTKSPNKKGEDIFLFWTGYSWGPFRSMDGISLDATDSSPSDGNYLCIEGYLAYCTKWVLTYNNMDYLKCRDKLQADGSVHSCKDAK